MRILAEHTLGHQFLAEVSGHAGLFVELDADPQPAGPNLLDLVRLDLTEPVDQILTQLLCVLLVLVGAQNLDHFSRDRAGQRVAAERAAVIAGFEYAQGVPRGHHRGNRHDPTTQGLAEDVHVRLDAFRVAAERGPAATQPRLNLVGDEQNVPFRAQFAYLLEVAGRRNDDAGLTLNRLDQKGYGIVIDRLAQRVNVAVLDDFEPRRERSKPLAAERVGAEADDRRRPPVEVVLAADDLGLIRRNAFLGIAPLAGGFDRGLDALRPGVHGQGRIHFAQLGQFLAQRTELIVVERPRG